MRAQSVTYSLYRINKVSIAHRSRVLYRPNDPERQPPAGVAGARASLAGSGLSLTRSKESRLTSVLTGARDQAADNVEQLGAVSESVEAMHEESAGFASMAAQARRQQSEGFLGDRI